MRLPVLLAALVLGVVAGSGAAEAQTCPTAPLTAGSGCHVFAGATPPANCSPLSATCVLFVIDADADGYAPLPVAGAVSPAFAPVPAAATLRCYEHTTGGGVTTFFVDSACTGATAPGVGDDCLDSDAGVHPGATEVAGDDVDENCDDAATCFEDLDADGFGTSTVSATTVAASNGATAAGACATPASFIAANQTDCLDVALATNPYSDDVKPGATEACDGYDTDCTGGLNATGEVDLDGDGALACANVAGANVGGGFDAHTIADCLDVAVATNPYSDDVEPGNAEACDGYDTDCAGGADFTAGSADELDVDADGWVTCAVANGSAAIGTTPAALGRALAGGGDCLDDGTADSPLANPGVGSDTFSLASGAQGNLDNDCDGLFDEDAVGANFVVVDEVTVDPASPHNTDWFELRNVTSVPIRLDGWVLSTTTNAVTITIPPGVAGALPVIPAGARAVVCPTPAPASVVCLPGVPSTAFGLEATDGLSLAFTDGGAVVSTTIDCKSWPTSVGGCDAIPSGAFLPGRSAQFDSTSWCASVSAIGPPNTDQGSPGAANPACNPGVLDVDGDGFCPFGVDTDGDGDCDESTTVAQQDCDDANDQRYIGAPEICDGLDNDCDTLLGDGVSANTTGGGTQADERDQDVDGYYACDFLTSANATAGSDGDCEDLVFGVHPGAAEVCDGYDTDCSLSTNPSGEIDLDGDTYLTCAGTFVDRSGADAFAGNGDCLDVAANAYSGAVRPGAAEVCDGYDTDCDAAGVPPLTEQDDDGDGWIPCTFDPGATLAVGTTPPGAAAPLAGGGDCLDVTTNVYSQAVSPGATEVCDGWDTDCDSAGTPPLDEFDHDGDQYIECPGYLPGGAVNGSSVALLGGADCQDDPALDTLGTVYPGATEVCDGWNNDCAGGNPTPGGAGDTTGPGTDPPTVELDDDLDRYIECAGFIQNGASTGLGLLTNGEDCVDDAANAYSGEVHPGVGAELCDGYDTDCVGGADFVSGTLDELDADGDGYVACNVGAPSPSPVGTVPPGWTVPLGARSDCLDDGANPYAAFVHPTAAEVCDTWDTDCDPATTSTPSGSEVDTDADGWLACTIVAAAAGNLQGAAMGGGDCLNAGADLTVDIPTYSGANGAQVAQAIHPTADNLCDGWVNDCTATGALAYVPDATDPNGEFDDDGDGFAECEDPAPAAGGLWDPALLSANADLSGGNDCVDVPLALNLYSDSVSPGHSEVCDGYDNDCDGAAEFTDIFGDELDRDGDGWLACDVLTTDPLGTVPPGMTGLLLGGLDCLDDPALDGGALFPGNAEVCDGLDNDCNPLTGYPPNVAVNLDVDLDRDGVLVCAGDCNDDPNNDGASVQPGAAELCDGVDNNCDGLTLPSGESDEDEDGQKPCDNDCNDNEPTMFRGSVAPDEEGRDMDCDGWIRVEQLDCDGDGQRPPPVEDPLGCVGYENKSILCFDQEVAVECRTLSGDRDGDGERDLDDNCPDDANLGQFDADADGIGDACDEDDDNDGRPDLIGGVPGDNCPLDANHDQDPRACDLVTGNYVVPGDADADGIADASDNCITSPNNDQSDAPDGDGLGDLCDPDDDGDGIDDDRDNCPVHANADQADADRDGVGDACDPNPTSPDERLAYWMADLRPFNVDSLAEVSDGVFFVRHARHVPLRPDGCSATGVDCDDSCAQRCEGAPEVCDGIDNDCDGTPAFSPDEVDALGPDDQPIALDGIPDVLQGVAAAPGLVSAAESDADNDGVPACRPGRQLGGEAQIYASLRGCDDPYAADLSEPDCNDSCALTFPGAVEVCDGILNDCAAGALSGSEKDDDRDDHTRCGPGTDSELDIEFDYLLVFDHGGAQVPLAPPAPAGLACGDCAGISWREPRGEELQVPVFSDVCALLAPGEPVDAEAAESGDAWRCGLTQTEFDAAVVGLCEAFPGSCRVVEVQLLPDGEESLKSMLGDDTEVSRLCAVDDVREECPEIFEAGTACAWSGPRADVVDGLTAPPSWGGSDARPESDVPTCALSMSPRTIWPGWRLSEARRVLTVWQGCSAEASAPLARLPDTPPSALASLCPLPQERPPPFEGDVVIAGEPLPANPGPVTLRAGIPFELQGFLASTLPAEASLHGCWSTGAETSEAAPSADFRGDVGGDCDDDRDDVHRDHVEGPSDVLSYVLLHSRGLLPPDVLASQGDLLDCRLCVDGVDNDCDGLIDSDDPSCDLCSREGCTGCATLGAPISGRSLLGLGFLAVFLSGLLRRSGRRSAHVG